MEFLRRAGMKLWWWLQVVQKAPLNHLSIWNVKVLEATQESTVQKIKRGYKAFHWRLLAFNVFVHGREVIWRLHLKDECQQQWEGTFKGPLEISCHHAPWFSQSEVAVPEVMVEETVVGENSAFAAWHVEKGLCFAKLLFWVPSHVF